MAITDGLNPREKEIFVATRREKGGSPTGLAVVALIATLIIAFIAHILIPLFISGWKHFVGSKAKPQSKRKRKK